MKIIDLRSDTVTKPTAAMRKVMAEADVGDDVYGEDPTINRLQTMVAERLNKEDALFVSSGTQSNLLALLSHCQRGEEYIVGQMAHTYKYEAGGAAVLGSIQPQPLELDANGCFDFDTVAKYVKPDDAHFAITRLLALENTHGGIALPMEYLQEAREFVDQHNLSLHLDGARIFNAAVKKNKSAAEIAQPFDSVSICLSKGLGAPVGSVLSGSKELIQRAHRWRKMLGGGMRQAGIIAAAGILALETHVERLAEDHENAIALAKGLEEIEEVSTGDMERQTNMVYIKIPKEDAEKLPAFMKENGILSYSGEEIRLVLHLDIKKDDIPRIISTIKEYYR